MKSSFFLPDLGEGLAEAEVIQWYVKEGDFIREDDPLLSVETAKALVDVPSPVTGKVSKIHVENETIVPTHCLLADFEVEDETSPSKTLEDQIKTQSPGSDNTPASGDKSEPGKLLETDVQKEADFQKNRQDTGTVVGKMNTTMQVSDDYFIIGKKRQKQAEKPTLKAPLNREQSVDANATTSHNTKIPPVLHSHTQSSTTMPMTRASALATSDTYDTETIRGSRRTMADAMQLSHETVAQVTLFDEADISSWFGKKDITTKLVHGICEAAKEVPRLNAWFDMEKRQLHIHHHVNLGLAVDTEDGLFVPVLQQINRVPQYKIRDVINEVVSEVKTRTASPERFKRATISLSNFGAIAGRYATPMIVPPAVAILGAGRFFETSHAYVSKKGKTKLAIKQILPLSLSFDHRAATGGEGARFLKALIRELEES